MTESPPLTTSTDQPSAVRVNLEHNVDTDLSCSGVTDRHIYWPMTGAGTVVSRQCPHGSLGVAERRCDETGSWSRGELGECRSVWVSGVSGQYRGGAGVGEVTKMIIQGLYNNTGLYGGDLGEILNLVDTSLKNIQLQTSDRLYRQDRAKIKVCKVCGKLDKKIL